jgi:hypothetical protein
MIGTYLLIAYLYGAACTAVAVSADLSHDKESLWIGILAGIAWPVVVGAKVIQKIIKD